jgi:hemerythrin superfamily protein
MPSTRESTAASTSTPELRGLLKADHERLEALFQRLLAALRADDRDEVGLLWKTFDEDLQAHLTFEDEHLVPELAKVHPEEAAAISSEHIQIRSSWDDLGMGVDLHRTNAEAVERFARTLKEHAKREEALMYDWAETKLARGEPSLRAQLLAAVRKLVGPGYIF